MVRGLLPALMIVVLRAERTWAAMVAPVMARMGSFSLGWVSYNALVDECTHKQSKKAGSLYLISRLGR